MVSPRRTVDVENRLGRSEGVQSNTLNLKNQSLLKPSSVPLGDVRNTLAATRQLFTTTKDTSKQGKEPELKPLKPLAAPRIEEVLEPKYDDPLVGEAYIEDTFNDIIPPYLQPSDEDWERVAWNCLKPRTGAPLSSEDDDDDVVFNRSIDSFDEHLLRGALDFFVDNEVLCEVPPVDSDDLKVFSYVLPGLTA